MHKLNSNIFVERDWGSEIIWAFTDKYMAKTIEVQPRKSSKLLVHQDREKSIIVIKGPLYLIYGPLGNNEKVESYKLTEGWSWYIAPGHVYKYAAMEDPVMLIEVSSPEIDDGLILVDEEVFELDTSDDFIEPPLV